jgi:hypothetical protein
VVISRDGIVGREVFEEGVAAGDKWRWSFPPSAGSSSGDWIVKVGFSSSRTEEGVVLSRDAILAV